MTLWRWLKWKLAWWRWALSSPYRLGDPLLGSRRSDIGRKNRDILIARWNAKEPKWPAPPDPREIP